MTGSAPPAPFPRAWPWLFVLAVAVGATIRLDQFSAQVLIDDEWHAVHQLLRLSPAQMFVEFGHADYSIPLGILDWFESRWFGLSETAMRWPMLACGLVTLVAFPLYVAPRLGHATASVFALLLAISPLLDIYSRIARPYAITLLLGWVAHAQFQRFHAAPRGELPAGTAYAIAAAMAIWLHVIVAPFVAAPFLWGLADLRHTAPAGRRARFLRLAALALVAGAMTAALMLPPLLAHPQSLSVKAATDRPGLETLSGVWYAWLGTPSTAVVVLCIALAAVGAREVWRAMPIARTGALGIVLTLAAVMITSPAWSHVPLTLARYLLPMLPLLLLATAAGSVQIASRVDAVGTGWSRAAAALVAVLPCVALVAQSPLVPLLRHPNAQTVHFVHYLDFRAEHNAYLPHIESIPMSPFWATLATQPAGTLRVAAAPFYFESYDWDAPRWERASRQTVIPGLLTGLCVDRRWGEVPQAPEFRFRNAVHLADATALAEHGIDYVVWQKPYVPIGRPGSMGGETAHCEAALRTRFGTPAFEDSHLIAFRLPGADRPLSRAQR